MNGKKIIFDFSLSCFLSPSPLFSSLSFFSQSPIFPPAGSYKPLQETEIGDFTRRKHSCRRVWEWDDLRVSPFSVCLCHSLSCSFLWFSFSSLSFLLSSSFHSLFSFLVLFFFFSWILTFSQFPFPRFVLLVRLVVALCLCSFIPSFPLYDVSLFS